MNEYMSDLGMETAFLSLKQWKTPQRKNTPGGKKNSSTHIIYNAYI